MEIIDSIKNRYSTVLFSHQQIENEKLQLLFEAARWAPSAFNEQPWRFIVGTKDHDNHYEKLLDCLVDGNKHWAQHAPVLVLVATKKVFSHNPNPNRSSFYDTGLAIGNLLSQATAFNLFVHQMGGFSIDKAKNEFSIPDEFEPIVIMAIGYKGDSEDFPEDLQIREKKVRIRKPLEDLTKFV
ncbi:MAG: nitroreductase family protein [Bacteroidales bacterium]|jgi:nitroreductase|nr:nitroreductase family protein [Bacteroidales bacterium]